MYFLRTVVVYFLWTDAVDKKKFKEQRPKMNKLV